MITNFNIIVSGKVQGVSYRASAVKIANLLGVKGFIQNLPDGKVYAEIEGEEEMLHRFIQWCHHGPDRAEVEHVSIYAGEIKSYNYFETR